jgi:NodT family efflux transporter outer membrane factor (OMF) lipoprotein
VKRQRGVFFLKAALAAIPLFFSGCQFYSSIDEPKSSANDQYLTEFLNPEKSSLKDFFDQFSDSQLVDLVKTALKNNKDLLIATEKIEESKALYGVAKSNLFPKLEMDAAAFKFKSGKETPISSIQRKQTLMTNIFLQAFTLSWELDLFGKIRNQKLQAAHNILKTEAAQKGVYVSLASEVALTYFEMSYYTEAIELYKKTLSAQEKLIDLSASRLDFGLESKQSLDSTKRFYYALSKTLPDLEAGLKRAKHHLAILIGVEPSKLKIDAKSIKPIEPTELFFHVLLPSDLINNRPDIIEARQNYLAASYGLRSAEGDLLPSFSLLGAFGYSNKVATSWFIQPSNFWTLGPNVRWPLFQGWGVLSNIKAKKSEQKQAMLGYQSTVLKALEDVENALVGLFQQQEKMKDAKETLQSQKSILSAENSLVTAGIHSLDQQKIEERVAFEDESGWLETKLNTVKAMILLYKSLGGSWK